VKIESKITTTHNTHPVSTVRAHPVSTVRAYPVSTDIIFIDLLSFNFQIGYTNHFIYICIYTYIYMYK
jgi:hypothetical protein